MSKHRISQLRRVMKRAWYLVKIIGGYGLSTAMQRAWRELKDRIARLGSKHEHQEERDPATWQEFTSHLLSWTLKMVVRPKERNNSGARLGHRVQIIHTPQLAGLV